ALFPVDVVATTRHEEGGRLVLRPALYTLHAYSTDTGEHRKVQTNSLHIHLVHICKSHSPRCCAFKSHSKMPPFFKNSCPRMTVLIFLRFLRWMPHHCTSPSSLLNRRTQCGDFFRSTVCGRRRQRVNLQ